MSETTCANCGAGMRAGAKFCPSCGTPASAGAATDETEVVSSEAPTAAQPATSAQPPAPPPRPQTGPASRDSAVRDLGAQLGTTMKTPAAMLAGAAGLLAAVVLFLVGLLMALVLPDSSITSLELTDGGSEIKEAFRQTASFTLAGIDSSGTGYVIRITPAIFGLLTLAISALSVQILSGAVPGVKDLGARTRLLAGLGAGIPLALAMLIFALISRESNDDVTVSMQLGGVVLLALLWGGLGGSIGSALSLRRDGRLDEIGLAPGTRKGLGIAAAALRPLAVLIAVCAVIGTTVWIVQGIRDAGEIRSSSLFSSEERSKTEATIDSVAYIFDNGVHYAELGAGAEFHTPITPLGLPVPVTKFDEVFDEDELDDFTGEDSLTPPGSFRLFNYEAAVPTWLFIASFGLILLVALGALYAGFAVARASRPRSQGESVAWGAAVGPIWAVTMVALNALVQKDVYGKGVGTSVLLMFLIGGAVLGALGGLLAGQSLKDQPASAAPPPPPPPA